MISDHRSIQLLKYAKAKAKLTEFGISTDDYPHFCGESSDLSFPGVKIITNFAQSIIDGKEASVDLLSDMRAMCDYYDAASSSQENLGWKSDYLLVAAATYYLLENFGSSLALSAQIVDADLPCISARALNHLLRMTSVQGAATPNHLEIGVHATTLEKVIQYLATINQIEEMDVLNAATTSHEYANATEDVDEVFFGEIFYACIKVALQNSSRKLLPQYSNLSLDTWSNYLADNSALRILWPAQHAIGEMGALQGESVVIQAPTGVGKTKSLALIIRSRILAGFAARIAVVAPLRALCREIANDLSDDLSDIACVVELSDVLQDDASSDFVDTQPTIAICTPEKLNYLIHHNGELVNSFDFFAFDEAHTIDSPKRGPSYELLLTEIKITCSTAQFILISAVLPNANDLTQWLFNQVDATTDSRKILTTKKSIGVAESNGTLRYYEYFIRNGENFFIPKSFEQSRLGKLTEKETKDRHFPELNDPQNVNPACDIALYYALRLAPNGSSAIYIPKKSSLRKLFARILELHQRGLSFNSLQGLSELTSLERLSNLLSLHYGANHPFSISVFFGVAPHYAGLPEGLRCSIEDDVTNGKIRCIACTPTLAQGVNLPIKYLLITGTQTGINKSSARDFQNLVGRVARSGVYSEGSVILTDYRDATDQRKINYFDTILDPENQEKCSSAILRIFSTYTVSKRQFSGNDIGTFIIENLHDEHWDVSIVKIMARSMNSSFEKMFASEIGLRKAAVESIENYLCLMLDKNSEVTAENQQEYIAELCKETFAYQMADETQRGLLNSLFSAIGKRLSDIEARLRIPLYASSMLGIASTDHVIRWLGEGHATFSMYDTYELLNALMDEFRFIIKKNISESETEILKTAAKLWIAGKSYQEIVSAIDPFNNQQQGISKVEKYCTDEISFRLSHLAGSVKEVAIALDFNTLATSFSTLQQQLKYGLLTEKEQLIYRKVCNDRPMAIWIGEILEDEIDGASSLRAEMQLKAGDILDILTPYPEYFTKRFSQFISV